MSRSELWIIILGGMAVTLLFFHPAGPVTRMGPAWITIYSPRRPSCADRPGSPAP